MIDRAGMRYERWLVIRFSHRLKKSAYWLCQCECGNEKIVNANNLISGKSASCGCLQKERASAASVTHRMSKHPLYLCWQRIQTRCTNERSKDYRHYGGRGIRLCERWRDFECFRDDMLSSWSDGLTIERIDTDGDYEPSNCRWATMAEQSRNTRRSVIIDTPWGRMNLADAADRAGIVRVTFRRRFMEGWSPEFLFDKTRRRRWWRKPKESP